MARKKKTIHNPALLAERRAEVDRLRAQGAEVTVDRNMEILGSRRPDVFSVMVQRSGKDGRPSLSMWAYEAFRDHERDVSMAMGWETPERRPDFIRGSVEGAPGQNIGQVQIDASRRVEAVARRLSCPDAALLDALMQPQAALCTRWRATVERVTRETRDEAQASRIRALGENLIDARKAVQQRKAA